MFDVVMKRKYLMSAVLSGSLLLLSVGMMEAWTSPVLEKMLDGNRSNQNPLHRSISSSEESWIGGLMSLGAAIGPFPAAYAADRFGRKTTLLALGVPLALSFATLVFAQDVSLYYLARVLSGITVGGSFAVLPMYIAEVSEASMRGVFSTIANIFELAGFLMAYSIGPLVSITSFNALCSITPCIFMLTFVVMPESPYYLVAKNKKKEVTETLRKLRNTTSDDNFAKELKGIQICVDNDIGGSIADIFKTGSTLKALTISLAMISFQQLSGVNVILYYAQHIFDATGSPIPSDVSSIIIGSVQFVASCIFPFFVDRVNRRMLFIFSAIGMTLAEVPLGVYFCLKSNGTDVESLYWLPVVCLVLFIVTCTFGFGPLPWTLMSEIFPENVKPLAASLTSSTCWTLSFIVTTFFNSMSQQIGMGGTFLIFSSFNVLAAIFTFVFVPETRGKTIQEIQEELYS